MPAPSHPRIRITASSSSQLLKFPVMALEPTARKHPHSPHRRWVKSSHQVSQLPAQQLSLYFWDSRTKVASASSTSISRRSSTTSHLHRWRNRSLWPTEVSNSTGTRPIHLSFASFMRTTLVVVVSLCVSLTNSLGPVSQQKIKPFTKNLQLEQPRATLGLKGSLPSSGPMLRLNLGKLHNWSCWHHQLQEQYSLLSWQYPEPLVRDTTSEGDPRNFCGKCQIKTTNLAISPVTSCWTGYQKIIDEVKKYGFELVRVRRWSQKIAGLDTG